MAEIPVSLPPHSWSRTSSTDAPWRRIIGLICQCLLSDSDFSPDIFWKRESRPPTFQVPEPFQSGHLQGSGKTPTNYRLVLLGGVDGGESGAVLPCWGVQSLAPDLNLNLTPASSLLWALDQVSKFSVIQFPHFRQGNATNPCAA